MLQQPARQFAAETGKMARSELFLIGKQPVLGVDFIKKVGRIEVVNQ
jgi:hypothetical protein